MPDQDTNERLLGLVERFNWVVVGFFVGLPLLTVMFLLNAFAHQIRLGRASQPVVILLLAIVTYLPVWLILTKLRSPAWAIAGLLCWPVLLAAVQATQQLVALSIALAIALAAFGVRHHGFNVDWWGRPRA